MLFQKTLSVALLSCVVLGASAKMLDGSTFANLQVGTGGIDTRSIDGDDHESLQKHRNGPSYRAELGYMFHLNEGIEVGPILAYNLYPKNNYSFNKTNINIDGNYKTLAGKVKLNLSKEYFVAGQIGLADVTQKVNGSVNNESRNFDTRHKTFTEVGVSTGFNFTDRFDLFVAYQHVFGQKFNSIKHISVAPIDTLTAGVGIDF